MTLNGAIKQLRDLQTADDLPFYYKPAIAEVINVLLMDVQEVKHGQWINDNGLYKCSACNTFTITGWANCIPIERMNKTMPYCPHCGAKMGAEEGAKNK